MLCKKCGAQIDDNATVCEFCGENFELPVIVEEEIIEQPDETVEKQQRSTHEIFEENKQKRQNQAQKTVDEKQQQLHEINERRELKRKREKRNRTIVIVVVCLIVAAAAATAAYLLKGQDPNIEPIPTATPVATLSPTLEPTNSPEPEEATPTPTAQTDNENVVSNQTQGVTQAQSNVVQPSATKKPTAPTQSSATQKPSTTVTNNGASRKGTGATSYKTPSKTSGVVNTNITSALAVGGEVVIDKATNKSLMTFVSNDTTYYAYVSQGSVTSMINGKYITLTAAPTAQTYNGNTIYDISSLTYYDDDGYIVPDSGVRYLTKSDLSKLTKKELGIARNEIYARHGRSFKIKEYSDYFRSKSWYKENPKYNYNNEAVNLNKIELKNVDLILSLENQR